MSPLFSLQYDPEWTSEFESLAFTAEALLAHPEPDDQELGQLARRIVAVLADGEEIEADARALRRVGIHTAARVRAADSALDHALHLFASDLLTHVEGRLDHDLYQRFFPEYHEDVIEMGLDAALPLVMMICLALDQDKALPEALRSHAEVLRGAVQLGNESLSQRADALADLGRHQARVEAWKSSAAATHRSVFRAVLRASEARGMPPRWSRSFFLQPPPLD